MFRNILSSACWRNRIHESRQEWNYEETLEAIFFLYFKTWSNRSVLLSLSLFAIVINCLCWSSQWKAVEIRNTLKPHKSSDCTPTWNDNWNEIYWDHLSREWFKGQHRTLMKPPDVNPFLVWPSFHLIRGFELQALRYVCSPSIVLVYVTSMRMRLGWFG